MSPTFGSAVRFALRALLGGAITVIPAISPALHASPAASFVIEDGTLAVALHRAVRGAARRLEAPACARVLDQFSDAGGRRLDQVVAALSLSPSASLSRITFRDGRAHPACQGGIAAFTNPGSRVVYVCGNRFAGIDRIHAEQIVIHEMLHTLGLGERPPAPGEIDRVVARHCAS